MMFRLKSILCLICLIAPLYSAIAEESMLSAQQMIQKLTPKAKATPATRSWGDAVDRGVKLELPTELPSIDLHILFAFGSADLTASAKEQLKQLGRALTSSELIHYRFDVAGHTDAVGDDDRNMKLSQSRSASVRSYLMQHYGIEAKRLQAIGYGESKLLDKTYPKNRINRRVQIVNRGLMQ